MVRAKWPLSEGSCIGNFATNPQPLHLFSSVPLDCCGVGGVEDTPGGFRGVEGVLGSLIAARPCATPDIGVVG